jgi:leucyl aminopeptidase (aminopeptidase T)
MNGDFEEEKKARGTVHIALGNGIYYGQSVDSSVHIDAVMYRPTVTFDDELIVKDGKVVILGDV